MDIGFGSALQLAMTSAWLINLALVMALPMEVGLALDVAHHPGHAME